MSFATVMSRSSQGMAAPLVTVEVFLSGGLPSFSIVGLPEAAVKESRDRVRSAIQSNAFEFPDGKVTVNLAPADLPKEGGGRFDLAIAMGVLAASKQLPTGDLHRYEFLGELSLSGELRHINGCLPSVLRAGEAGRLGVLPAANSYEASLVTQATSFIADHLTEVVAHFKLNQSLPLLGHVRVLTHGEQTYPDLNEVKGQDMAKRALEIAAAGGHSLLLMGPPGTGKTMLASRLPGLLPPMTDNEAIQSACVLSISGKPVDFTNWRKRPFRSPHHTASAVALVGGGSTPKPGEISLAHNGVLFLDELPEFKRHVLEVLREPMENGRITISRASQQVDFPSRFQFVAAMNPCPCGYLGDRDHTCRCSQDQVDRYRQKISGPLLDRIDMHLDVPKPPLKLFKQPTPKNSETEPVARRVATSRKRQRRRQKCINAHLNHRQTQDLARTEDAEKLLERAMESLHLSLRGHDRVLRLARTLADLDNFEKIEPQHVAEAIHLRCLDRR